MIEQDLEMEFNSFEDIGKFIVGLQDDLETLAAHLIIVQDEIAQLKSESKSKNTKESESKSKNQELYYEYLDRLKADDIAEREKKMKEEILQSFQELLPKDKGKFQKFFNIFILIFGIFLLIISIKGAINV